MEFPLAVRRRELLRLRTCGGDCGAMLCLGGSPESSVVLPGCGAPGTSPPRPLLMAPSLRGTQRAAFPDQAQSLGHVWGDDFFGRGPVSPSPCSIHSPCTRRPVRLPGARPRGSPAHTRLLPPARRVPLAAGGSPAHVFPFLRVGPSPAPALRPRWLLGDRIWRDKAVRTLLPRPARALRLHP